MGLPLGKKFKILSIYVLKYGGGKSATAGSPVGGGEEERERKGEENGRWREERRKVKDEGERWKAEKDVRRKGVG